MNADQKPTVTPDIRPAPSTSGSGIIIRGDPNSGSAQTPALPPAQTPAPPQKSES